MAVSVAQLKYPLHGYKEGEEGKKFIIYIGLDTVWRAGQS